MQISFPSPRELEVTASSRDSCILFKLFLSFMKLNWIRIQLSHFDDFRGVKMTYWLGIRLWFLQFSSKILTFRSEDLNPRFSVLFLTMIWILMWSEEPEIKSKQASKRGRTLSTCKIHKTFLSKTKSNIVRFEKKQMLFLKSRFACILGLLYRKLWCLMKGFEKHWKEMVSRWKKCAVHTYVIGCTNVSKVMEFRLWGVLKSKNFGQKSTYIL